MRALPAWLALLPMAALAQAPGFMDGAAAYEAGDASRCADVLLAVEAANGSFPANGELLTAECLAQAGRFEEAFAYLRRQLPKGRIRLDELRGKSRPGLDALRRQPGWSSLLVEAMNAEVARLESLDAGLRDELLARAARDQAARQAQVETPGAETAQAVAAVDRDNAAWLESIVEARGWPDAATVGRDGADAARMLVQHADHDVAFQARALALMEPAVRKGTVERADFALLTDRVLRAQGKPQRYGTQFETREDGVMRMQPVEDEAGLDARRAAMGLPTMVEYKKLLSEAYGQPVE